MRLLELELTNVCQHKHLKWEFCNGLVGVFGSNGSGKSNALNVAGYGAMTGDYSRHVGGKTGLIRQQAGDEGKSQIRWKFRHDGHDVEIVRGLQRPSNNVLYIDGEKHLSKANEIQAYLEAALGLPRQLVDRYVFVGQTELYSFLSDTPAERAKSLAYLCGTTSVEKCWEEVGKFIEMDRDLSREVVDNSDEILASIGEHRKSLARFQKQIEELEGKVLPAAKVKKLSRQLQDIERCAELAESVEQLKEKEAAAKQEAIEARKHVKDWQAAVGEDRAEVQRLSAEAEVATAELAAYEAANKSYMFKVKAKKKLKFVEHELAELPPKPDTSDLPLLEDYQTPLAELNRDIADAQKRLSRWDVGDVSECPTCGTPVADFKDKIDELREQLDNELLPRRDKLEKAISRG
jgi:DNA repair exonuclease SbcCD ATPase subunit